MPALVEAFSAESFKSNKPPFAQRRETDAEEVTKRVTNASADDFIFAVRETHGKKVVGAIYMTRRGDSGIWFDLGYWLRDAFAGKGIMTMALKAALEHASSVRDVSGIMSDIIVANKSSQRIMSKVGFRFLETMSRKVIFPHAPDHPAYADDDYLYFWPGKMSSFEDASAACAKEFVVGDEVRNGRRVWCLMSPQKPPN